MSFSRDVLAWGGLPAAVQRPAGVARGKAVLPRPGLDEWGLPAKWTVLAVVLLLMPTEGTVTAWSFVLAALLPIVVWLDGKSRILLPLALISAAYLVGVPLQILLQTDFASPWPVALGEPYKDLALRWILEGFLAFVLGFLLAARPRAAAPGERQSEPVEIRLRATRILAWAGTAGTLGQLYLSRGQVYTFSKDLDQSASSSTQMVMQLGIVAAPLAVFLWERAVLEGKARRLEASNVAVWASTALLIMGSGTKGLPLLLLLAVGLPQVMSKRRSAIELAALFAAGVVATLLVFSVFTNFRDVAAVDTLQREPGLIGNLRFQVRVMDEAVQRTGDELRDGTVFGVGEGAGRSRVEQAIDRLSGSSLGLATCIQMTNGQSSYENLVWAPALPVIAFVPRGIWPDKPIFLDSGIFATMLGWNRPGAPVGGISVGLAGSLYWISGHGGIIVGMLCLGWFGGLTATRAYGRRSTSWFWEALAFFVICSLVNVGVEATSLVISSIRMMALLGAIHLFAPMRWDFSASGRP
ncbi:MAG TPA: hypothetical protein PLB02_00205 [Thermoanaerobaculia bacterium]|nr:hypothetical protein [Thermoanaerobaculia bacterium]